MIWAIRIVLACVAVAALVLTPAIIVSETTVRYDAVGIAIDAVSLAILATVGASVVRGVTRGR